MPLYEHFCPHGCGRMELFRRMTDKAPRHCPMCHELGLERIFNANFIAPCDSQQENKNGGLGEWYPELGARFEDAYTKKIPNRKAYAKSRVEAEEKFKRKGCTTERC